jgi:L-threonylcarbamoyladenylate synthase
MTSLWRITDRPTALQLHEIARLLLEGRVVLLPTDTIYGLHAVATDEQAVDRIAGVKGREETKPFVVIASSIDQFPQLGIAADPDLLVRLASIWPAPLTAILPLEKPIAASRGASTLAVRVPDLEWLRDLAARTGPLVSTSANRSGAPAATKPGDLAPDLLDSIDGVVDAGPLSGEPSAILDLTAEEPRFLREGLSSFTQKVWKTLRNSL